jgi:2-iminobutanoate/2-iminopropanoate deaminase
MNAIQRYPSDLPYPFSKAVRAGGFVFLSGQIPVDQDGRRIDGDITAQTRAVMDRLGETLQSVGADFADVVRVTVWLSDLAQFGAFNEVYAKYFEGALPARSTVQAKLAFDVGVEIEVQAWVGDH